MLMTPAGNFYNFMETWVHYIVTCPCHSSQEIHVLRALELPQKVTKELNGRASNLALTSLFDKSLSFQHIIYKVDTLLGNNESRWCYSENCSYPSLLTFLMVSLFFV